MPRVTTFFMDQISEHQRDLSNSASQRFVAEYLAGFTMAASRMAEVIGGLAADRERLVRNLAGGNIPGGVMAEPAYILLAETGVADAHEVIRRITLRAEAEGLSFAEALARDGEILSRIAGKMTELGLINHDDEAPTFFGKPERYRGRAPEKAQTLARKYRELLRPLAAGPAV